MGNAKVFPIGVAGEDATAVEKLRTIGPMPTI